MILVSCNCLPQIPIQTIYADENCEAILPNYLPDITVLDNCEGVILTQIPLPGYILNAANPYTEVIITAKDISGNLDVERFDVVLIDTIPPEIIMDSSMFITDIESTSQIMTAYHNSLGQFRDQHGGMDSTFYKKQLVTISGPGYNSDNFGIFYNMDHYILGLDSDGMADLGIYIDPEPMYVDAGGSGDDGKYPILFQQSEGYTWTNDTISIEPPFNSERFGEFEYNFYTGPGTFNVNIYFTEIYWTEPGRRIFDVVVEGETVISDLDIYAEIGFGNVLGRTFKAEAFGESLDIRFVSKTDYAKVSAILVSKYSNITALH